MKLREAIGSTQAGVKLSGEVEIDGAYFGGHVRQENEKKDRTAKRLAEENMKRQSLVVARQRGGRILPIVVARETDGVAIRAEEGPKS